jgi:alpha-tubulin suppressor-like RCC1 family protein
MRKISIIAIGVLTAAALTGQVLDGGNGHAIILDKKGKVWTIGRNNYGQLGDSTHQNSAIPLEVKRLSNKQIVAISRGYDHSIALDAAGNLYLWGRNNYGQLGYMADDQGTPQKLQNHKDFIAVEGGYWHTVALKKDGTVWTWGHNFYAELGNGTREHSPWPVGVLQSSNGTISPMQDVVSIASVGYHTLALKKDGTVWGWGGNEFNELGKKGEQFQRYAIQVQGIPTIKQIAVGWHHSIALDKEGHIWVWGSDPAFQFKETTAKFYAKPTRLEGLPICTKIACGSWHSLAIDENKNVWGWGKNHFGMLGTNDTISRSKPVLIKSLKNIVDIGAGCFESIALDADGKLFTFGDNPSGQLGIGNYKRCFVPQLMNLDITGQLKTEVVTSVRVKKQIQPVKKETIRSGMDTIVILKIIKYVLVAFSIILNIVLYKRLKKTVPVLK